MTIERVRIPVTTDAAGAATAYSQSPIGGKILQVSYTPDASTPLDTAATIALTGKSSGIVIASHGSLGTVAFSRSYRQAVWTSAAAALYAAAGQPLLEPVVLYSELLKLVIAAGGDTRSGTFDVYYER